MNAKAKSLIGNILPALGGLFVTYLYNVVDGIFVGRGVGSAALGAVNIAVPFITFVVALTAMFPMGGATVVAIRMGRGDRKGENHAFMTAFSLTLLMFAILMAVGMVFSQQIVDLSGAKELSAELRRMSAQYLFYYSAFSVPMLMGTCLSVFVRNDGSPTCSFIGMCAGAVANIFLDWLFIYPLRMGIIGVSTFSVLSFIYSLANAILSGVAQGLQPLWGQCYGRKDTKEMKWYFRSGLVINIVLSLLIFGGLFFFDVPVIRIFNREPELIGAASAALPYFSLSFIPMVLNLIYTAYFFSTKRTRTANTVAVSRGIVVKALMIFCLPLIFGTEAIWLAPFVTELITLAVAVVLSRTSKLIYR